VSLFDLAFGAQKNADKAQAKGASTDSWGTSAAAQHVTHMSLHDSDSAEKKGKAAGPTTTSNMYVASFGWLVRSRCNGCPSPNAGRLIARLPSLLRQVGCEHRPAEVAP
jgi:hypothetical protein